MCRRSGKESGRLGRLQPEVFEHYPSDKNFSREWATGVWRFDPPPRPIELDGPGMVIQSPVADSRLLRASQCPTQITPFSPCGTSGKRLENTASKMGGGHRKTPCRKVSWLRPGFPLYLPAVSMVHRQLGHWEGMMKAAPGLWPWGGVPGGTLAEREERFGDGCQGLPGVVR